MDRTYVYIDGFNLFYGAVRPDCAHWLNLDQMCRLLLQPTNQITRIKYFTAMVSDTEDDRGKSIRQQTYHRALKTLPNIEIIKGQFAIRKMTCPPVGCQRTPPCFIRVRKRDEKGSDVNLASHLLHDGHRDMYDTAVVVSGDSDLAEPIRMVAKELRKKVGVINPRNSQSKELSQYAMFYETLRAGVLRKCQFPDEIACGGQVIIRPEKWSKATVRPEKKVVHRSRCSECTNDIVSYRY